MYVAFGDDGLFDVMNASGMVQRGFASEAAAKEYIANQTPDAIGATFKKDGLFAGKVHAPEEIIPQAAAQRGWADSKSAGHIVWGHVRWKGFIQSFSGGPCP